MKSFLSDRAQMIDIRIFTSITYHTISDVIQGSVWGPILYLLYINDIISVINYGNM